MSRTVETASILGSPGRQNDEHHIVAPKVFATRSSPPTAAGCGAVSSVEFAKKKTLFFDSKRSTLFLNSFGHKRDIESILIVRRLAPVGSTTATLAVLASCDASPSRKTQTRRVRFPRSHVGRSSALPSP